MSAQRQITVSEPLSWLGVAAQVYITPLLCGHLQSTSSAKNAISSRREVYPSDRKTSAFKLATVKRRFGAALRPRRGM